MQRATAGQAEGSDGSKVLVSDTALARLLRSLDPAVAEQVQRRIALVSRPMTVRVTGRPRAGVSTVGRLLAPIAVADASGDVPMYVLPGTVRAEDRAAIAALERPIVVFNKADAHPGVVPESAVPLVAHVAHLEVTAAQLAAVCELRDSRSVEQIVFSDSPIRRWGPAAVAVAVAAARDNPDIDEAGVADVLNQFSGVAGLHAVLRARSAELLALSAGGLIGFLEQVAVEAGARDDVEEFLFGPAGEVLAQALHWDGAHDTPRDRRAALRTERVLAC